MILAVALAALIHACAPHAGARTMAAIVRVESNGDPYAIHDNTTGRDLVTTDRRSATETAIAAMRRGDSIDLGLAQINGANLGWLGLSVADAFDPCRNLSAGSTVLEAAYRRARERYPAGTVALYHALGAYNSGSIYGGAAYLTRILEAAGISRPIEVRPAVLTADATHAIRGSHTTAATLGVTVPVLAEATPRPWLRAVAPTTAVDTAAEPHVTEVSPARPVGRATVPVVIDGATRGG